MRSKSTILAAAFAGFLGSGAFAPEAAQAGGAERFQKCLAESALKPNETIARSECFWKHWSYMASYGP